MKRLFVESKNIKSIAYDQYNLLLEVEFKNNSIYQYFPFYENQWKYFTESESKGSWFNKEIKKNRTISCKKIK